VWDFVFIGRGTPAVWDPPQHFIRSGPYRTVRNPMYVGMFTLIAAEALLWRSSALAVYLAVLALSFHVFVLVQEEPALRRKFGAAYHDYCRRVPRWIPRFKQNS
jgi:protein-S-isoprenylcysteine O-methyltransferase Ste14